MIRKAPALIILFVCAVAWALTDFAPHNMTALNLPSPYVTSASTTYNGTFQAYNAFDGDVVIGGPSFYNWLGSGGALNNVASNAMTGNSAPSPFVASASTEFNASFAAWKAFDPLGAESFWAGTNNGVDWLQIDLGSGNAVIVISYAIRVNSSGTDAARAPKNWTLKGSNDGSSFTVVHTATNQTAWATDSTRIFQCTDVSTAYRYWRLDITANNGDSVTQVANLYLSTIALTVAGTGVDWLELDTGGTHLLGSYAIQVNGTPEPTRAPKDWVVQGSNDNSTWTTVATITNQTGWSSGEIRTFTCDTVATFYRYFRVYVTANNGAMTYTQIAELYLYSGASGVRHRTIQ